MKKIIDRHHVSFTNAFEGLFHVFKTQPNYITHLTVSIILISIGIYLTLSYNEWLIILTLIVTGFVVETINTAIEATTDAISREWRADIKIAKDVSAAAMLIFAIGAIVIGGIIFIPKLFTLFNL